MSCSLTGYQKNVRAYQLRELMMTNTTSQLEMKNNQLFINGQWVEGSTANTYDVINPATEDKLATIAFI